MASYQISSSISQATITSLLFTKSKQIMGAYGFLNPIFELRCIGPVVEMLGHWSLMPATIFIFVSRNKHWEHEKAFDWVIICSTIEPLFRIIKNAKSMVRCEKLHDVHTRLHFTYSCRTNKLSLRNFSVYNDNPNKLNSAAWLRRHA